MYIPPSSSSSTSTSSSSSSPSPSPSSSSCLSPSSSPVLVVVPVVVVPVPVVTVSALVVPFAVVPWLVVVVSVVLSSRLRPRRRPLAGRLCPRRCRLVLLLPPASRARFRYPHRDRCRPRPLGLLRWPWRSCLGWVVWWVFGFACVWRGVTAQKP
jgi:hypothetical protein